MPTDNESTKWLYQQLSDRGYNVGKDLSEFDNLMRTNKESREWAFQTARSNGLNVGKDQSEFDSLVAPIATGQPTTSTQAGIAAQQVVDEYDRSVAENSNNTPLSTPEQERQPVQSQESTPRAQFVPEYSNVKGFTVAKDSPLRRQYPFLDQLGEDEQAYFRTDTNEPLYAWKDSEGKDITPDEAATLNQRADIEQNDAIRPRQVPVTSLQLPEEVKSSGIRTDKKVSEYADELLKQQYGDGYWDKIFTDENGNEISGEELRNNLAQETYNALTDDIRKARIALFEAGGDKEAEAEINTGMANKWQGVMSDKRMLETLHDENAMKQDVKDYAQGEIDKAREEERRIIEEMNKRGEELDAASSPYVDQTFNTRQVDNRYTFLTTKLNAVRDRIRSWEAVRDSDDYGAMRALKDTAGNLRSWDLGYSDMIKGMHLVFGTEQDKKELANLLGNAERAKNFEQKAISDFARYVQIGGQSLPFMATFVGSGGGFRTLSEGVAKGAVKWAERKALQGIQKNAVKYLGVAAGDILAGYTLSGTLQGMGTLGDIMQRRAGDIEYNTEKGEYELVNPRGWVESAYKGATASMIDNATELLGDHLNIGKAAMKLLPKAGLKQVSDWLTKAGKSELYTTTREWLKRAGINGLGGEILEEEMAIPMNAVFVGDNPLLFGDGGLLDAKTQKDIVFGVGLSVFAMNAAAVSLHGTGQGINALQTMFDKDQRRLDAADIAAIEIIGGQWTEIKNEIDNATNEELADVAQKIADDKELNEEQKKAAGEYVTSTLQMRGHNLGENAAMQSNEQRDAYLDSVLSPEERQNVHDDGMIHAAVLYPTAENNGQPQEVFITKGNIVMNADGTINAEASDKEIYYKGADGQAHITSPDKFQSVAQPINVEEYAAANAPQEAQAGYTPGQQVSVNIDGQDIQGEVTNVGEDGNVLVSFENPDGTLSSRWLAPEELEQSNGRIAEGQEEIHNGQPPITDENAQPAAVDNVQQEQPAQMEQPIQEATQQTVQTEQASQPQQTEASVQEQTALSRIPVDEKGKPVYDKAEPDLAWDAIMEKTDGDEEMAKNVVDAMVKQQETEVDKLKKKQPKAIPGDVDSMIAAQKEKKAAIAAAEERLEQWRKIADTPNRRAAATNVQPTQNPSDETSTQPATAIAPTENTGNVEPADTGNAQTTEQGTEVPAGVQGTVEDGTVPERTSEDRQEGRSVPDRTEEVESATEGLTSEDADNLLSAMEARAEVAPDIELTPTNWVEQFGEDGMVDTPIGKVKMGENQIAKLFTKGRSSQFGMIRPTLTNPDVIVEVPSSTDNANNVERPTSLLFIKTFLKNDGSKVYYFKSVTVKKDGLEVSVSSHLDRKKRVEDALRKGKLQYRFDGGAQTEHRPADVSVTTPLAGQGASSKGNATIGDQSVSDMENGTLVSPQLASSESKDTQTSANEQTVGEKIAEEEAKVEQNPTEAQKEAGNYKKGHIKIDGYDVTIENPKGSVRSGVDRNGQEWSVTMNNTYGYIRGTEGVDGDHIDVYLSDDIENWDGKRVFVIDVYNEDSTFDEHKVMLGFNNAADAFTNYVRNYSPGFFNNRRTQVSDVSSDVFRKWINSSHRKTKPFAEYKSVNKEEAQNEPNVPRPIEGESPVDYARRLGESKSENKAQEQKGKAGKDLPLTETEYANMRMKELMEENPQLDEDDAENQALDEYPSYIGEKIKSGELENLYAELSINGQIKLSHIVESAGFDVSDISGKANKERQDEKKRNIHNEGEHITIEFNDGTLVTGEIIKAENGKITVLSDENKRKYTVPEKSIINTDNEASGNIRFREADNEISDFARKHNLNEKDVQDYADYMRQGNLNGVSGAFHDIRRKIRIDNKGVSLGQFAKIFSPIRKELYEKFGNIDDLREQYVQAEMEERNMMEAARKRAEEAAEAERRRLQVFQDMSDEQLDEEYSKAVEANDESRMRDLVNEAARRNGYGDVGSEYQGVGAWSAPSNPGYESDEKRRAAVENDAPDVNITDIANGYSQQPSDYFTNLRAYGTDTAHGRESAEAINKAIDEVRNGKDPMVKVYRAVPKSVKEGKLRNGDWVTPSRKYAEMHGDNRLEGDYRIIEQEVPASQLWWDGNDINEWGFDDGKGYAYRNTKNNRKLNDLITRDDKGNIIPLSQRFNARKADVRYRFIGEQGAARLDAAEEATTRLDNLSTARQMEQAYNDKKARIDKLRDSKPVEITGEEYKGKYDLNRDSAQDFILKNLRGEYTIADTGEKVTISKVGAKKVTSHSMGNNAHLKSIVAIPQLLENAIFIEETPNEKSNGKYDSYRYYVVGLKIGNEDYTARITIGVKNGEYYYDHYLTEIEKGNLIEIANGFIPTGDAPVPSYTKSKDTRLISLLQTNDQENARKIKLATGWERGADGKWRYETPDFEYHPNGDARQNDKYKESDWYKELYDLEERLFNGETLTDEETKRFDELAARENEIRDNEKNTERIYLDDYVKDDELFNAYPELKQTRVDFVDLPNEEYSAKYNSEENRITVNQAKSMDVKSVLAHEIQHAIQRIEGFASGSNTDSYRNAATSENVIADINAATGGRLVESGGFNNTPEGIFDALNRKTTYGTILRDNSTELDEVARKYGYETIFDLVNDIGKFKSSVEMYRSEAGEVEARNVQERLNMTPEQRRNTLAEETEDVAREDQQFLQDAIGTSESLASTEQSNDIDTAVADTANKLNVGVRVAHSVDEVSDEGVRRAIEKGRNVKGWYDTRTGEIVVYAPNATDADDAVRTVLHEGVAHYGLRQLVGDENFDTFLDNIYNNVDGEIKAAIDEKAQRHGWSTRVATEEYLASLAEDTNFEAARSSGLWQRIKDFFMDLLTKAGVRLNEALTDNELRYILWRSYENLAEPNGRDIIGTVRDVAMQGRLGVGNYGNEDMRLREAEDEQTPEKKSENKYRELYDKRVSRRRARLNRSYFDSMQPVKVLQKTITEETGQQIRPEENVYLQENRANSMAQRKHEMWERGHMEPARREVTKLMQQIMGGNWLTRRFKLPKTRRNAYNAVVRYMKSKHGLENNEYRRNMEAEAAREPFEAEIGAVEKQVKDGNISRAEADKRQAELKEQADKAETESRAKTLNKDYSGLQGIYGKDFERKAKEYVEDFEGAYDTAPLWREWNGATKAILEEEYKSGLLSKELYDRIRNMYKYYIPLKGWAENRAEDVYTYYATGSGDGGKPHRREGRTSESDDPLVTLEQDADRQFTAAARNRTKQALYNLATAHKSSLLTVRRQWYQNMGTKENPDWQRKDPEIPENATPEQMEQIIKDFEKDMRKLEKEGTAMRQKKPMILPYHATKSMEKEHTVRVMVNGKEYVIYVNGNPAAAQAVNGTSTPQDPDGSVLKRIYGALRWINRVKASLLTAVNVNFIPGNLVRDAQYSIQNMKAKEPVGYVLKYVKNLGEGMAKMTSARLFYKDKKGTLNMDDKTERLFKEFLDNGGETGYTARYTLEKQRRRNMAAINRMTGIDWLAGLRMLQHSLEYVNRSVETIVRFAAYKTSREAGRSIAQSINDAKEASVNFDKHGSGELGNKEWRLAYIFSNVGFQALRRLLENASGHPVRFTLAQIERLALGFAVPMMAKAMLDAYGDDDEKDAYEALPEWMRESGLAVPVSPILRKVGADDAADKVKRVFLYLPLGPEDKIWYALGENTWHLFNKDNITEEEAMDMAVKFGSLAADLLPLDFQGYGGNPIVSLAPTPVQDFVALEQNVNYWGQPIYRESTNYNEHDPGHRLAFTGTPEWYVERAEDINRLTGGDEYTKGWLSPKPEQIEYFINQTGGGVTRVVNQVMSLIERAGEDGNKDIQVLKNVPIVSSLVKKADVQDGKDGFDREKYYDYIDEYEKALHDYNAYRKAKRNGDDEAGQKAEKLKESPTGERMDIIRKDIRKIRNKDKQVRRIDEKENPTAEEEARRDKLKTESNELKQKLLEKLDKVKEKPGKQ